jgi:GxxExxY protein
MTRQEYKDIYDVVGAAQEVHKTLGRGLSELIYQEALSIEMKERGMEFEREKQLNLYYKNHLMEKTYFADFYYKGIIIELKAVDKILSEHRSQLFNYMRITRLNRGILINFCERSLRAERYYYEPDSDSFVLLTQDNYKRYVDDGC